jgi:hypothetical protein
MGFVGKSNGFFVFGRGGQLFSGGFEKIPGGGKFFVGGLPRPNLTSLKVRGGGFNVPLTLFYGILSIFRLMVCGEYSMEYC